MRREPGRSPLSRRGSVLAALALLLFSGCLDLTDHFQPTPPPTTDVTPDGPVGALVPWSGDTVRIATFNVRLLFDTVCDSGRCGPGDFEQVLTEAELAARADQIATAIRALDPDIILLQEIENQNALDALLTRLPDQFNTGVIGETGFAGSIDVAVMANGRIVEEVRHGHRSLPLPSGGTTTFTREFLEVHLALSRSAQDARRAEVIVFVGHFKSKANDDPPRRLAEAQAAHDIVTAVAEGNRDRLVVFGGDLNDTPGSPPLTALEASDLLYRVAQELPPSEQATWGQQAIDHLYVALRAAGTYDTGTARVFRDNGGWGGSDHGALVAEFELDVAAIVR
jgi:uncharacterized protein